MERTEKIIVNAQPEPSTGSKADLVRDATPSDDEPLSRTDRFLITSMLMDDYPPSVKIAENTIIGGATLKSVMELGRFEL